MVVHKNYFRLIEICNQIEPVYKGIKFSLTNLFDNCEHYDFNFLIQRQKDLRKEYLDFISEYFEKIAELTGNSTTVISYIAQPDELVFLDLGGIVPESLRNIALGTGNWVNG